MNKELIKTYSYRITSASRSDLVVILYDMAMDYIKDAAASEEPETFKENVRLAARVIDRLTVSLDMQYDISVELFKIYNHIKRTLIKVSVSGDTKELERVNGLLAKLRKSFYEVSKQDTSGPLMKNTEKVYSGLTYSKSGLSNETASDTVSNRGFIV